MSTQNELRIAMIRSAIRYHMVAGTFGPLPYNGVHGPRSEDGGFYKRVLKYVEDSFGFSIGRGTINDVKAEAITEHGATVAAPTQAIKPLKPRVYMTECPPNISNIERAIVEKYERKSDYDIVQFLKMNTERLNTRKRITMGILQSYKHRGELTGRQRFTLIMAIHKEVLAPAF